MGTDGGGCVTLVKEVVKHFRRETVFVIDKNLVIDYRNN